MSNFSLHPRLKEDCHHLHKLDLCHLLLLNNAHFRWFILVPEVSATEIHLLPPNQRDTLHAEIQSLSEKIDAAFSPDKMNVAAIGNMVPQLHYHLIARYKNDPAWPGVVWGCPETRPYLKEEIEELKTALDLPS